MARVSNRKGTSLVPGEQPAPAQPAGKVRGRKAIAPAENGPQPTPRPRRAPAKPAPVLAPQPDASQSPPLKDDIAAAAHELEELRRQARTAHTEWAQQAREQARTLHESFVGAQHQLSESVRLQVEQLRQLLLLLQQLPEEVNKLRQQLRQLPEEVGGLRQPLQDLRRQLPDAVQRTHAIREELDRVQRRVQETSAKLEDVKQEIQEVVPQPEAPPPVIVMPIEGRNRLGLTVAPGVVIAEVQLGSAAARAGLARGDVLTAVNRQAVHHAAQLPSLVQDAPPDEPLTLQIVRRATPMDIQVTLEERRNEEGPPAEGRDRLGVTVGPGVVVDEVAPGTPAAAALARGDVILAMNNAPVVNGEELRLAVHQCAPGAEVTLQVVRGGEAREVKARLDEPAPIPTSS